MKIIIISYKTVLVMFRLLSSLLVLLHSPPPAFKWDPLPPSLSLRVFLLARISTKATSSWISNSIRFSLKFPSLWPESSRRFDRTFVSSMQGMRQFHFVSSNSIQCSSLVPQLGSILCGFWMISDPLLFALVLSSFVEVLEFRLMCWVGCYGIFEIS